MSVPPETIAVAVRHLKSSDPVMREVIGRVGPFGLRLERNRFGMLVRSILSQQISTAAARSIRQRVQALLPGRRFSASALMALSDETLRQAGVSPQKILYLRDLCAHVLENRLPMRRWQSLDDEEIIAELIQVKGIGRWTAQMFLIFSLGRLDVFPHDDFGIRTALRNLYGLDELPGKAASFELAEPWRPYATVASWYCWRSIDPQFRSDSRSSSSETGNRSRR